MQLSRMLFIDSALAVHLLGQSTLNRGYSNGLSFWVFCSIPSLLGDILIRLTISYIVSILSFKNRTFFTKFKAHPQQCMKCMYGFLSETPFLIPHIFFAPSNVFYYFLSGKRNCRFNTAGNKFTSIREWIWITLAENGTTSRCIRNNSTISSTKTKTSW